MPYRPLLFVFVIMVGIGAITGCTRMLQRDEYVPFILDDLEAVGMFEDSPAIALVAIKNETFPPSWRVGDRDLNGIFLYYPPSVSLGPFAHPHDRRLYTGNARITPVVGEEQFFEIRIWASGGHQMLSRSGVALIRATSRHDVHVVAIGKTSDEVDRQMSDRKE